MQTFYMYIYDLNVLWFLLKPSCRHSGGVALNWVVVICSMKNCDFTIQYNAIFKTPSLCCTREFTTLGQCVANLELIQTYKTIIGNMVFRNNLLPMTMNYLLSRSFQLHDTSPNRTPLRRNFFLFLSNDLFCSEHALYANYNLVTEPHLKLIALFISLLTYWLFLTQVAGFFNSLLRALIDSESSSVGLVRRVMWSLHGGWPMQAAVQRLINTVY